MHYFFSRYGFLIIIIGLYLITAWYFPVAYIWLTYEDLFGEWTQTLYFGTAVIFSFRLFLAKSAYRWFFLALGTSCFYVFMEEISWGQRIFGITSPEFFKRHNLQRETNLHNMLTGPYSTIIKSVLEYAIAVMFILYGLVYPLLIKYQNKMGMLLDQLKIPAPPLFLAPYFLVAAFLEPEPIRINEAEVTELLAGFALAVLSIHYWYAHKYQQNADKDKLWEAVSATRYQYTLFIVCTLVPVSAVLITSLQYLSPGIQHRIDDRVYNGYKIFARRYQFYQHWDNASTLLLKVYQINPRNTDNLRRLASIYRRTGDKSAFNEYNTKAIKTDLRKYKKKPYSISANLSLAKSYRLKGDKIKAKKYGLKAFRLAIVSAIRNPNNAIRVYWLGETLAFLGKHKKAYRQFKKAMTLNPSHSRIRKAYKREKRLLKNGLISKSVGH